MRLFLALLALPAHAQDTRLCVQTVVVAPSKADGRPWDGPGSAAHAAAELLHLAAETPEEKAATQAAPAVAELLERSAAAPDLVVTLRLGDRVLLTTPKKADTIAAAWTGACVTLATADLTRVRLEVIDADLQHDDPIGNLNLSHPLRPFAPFGGVRGLTLTAEPLARLVELAHGQVRIPADQLTRLELTAPGPGTLLLDWTVGGRTAGLEGAHDDELIGYSLHAPAGHVLDEMKKHTTAQRRISIREGGTYGVVFSNDGWLRASAREVSYRFRFEPK